MKRPVVIAALFLLPLLLGGCFGSSIEQILSQKYPAAGDVVDEFMDSQSSTFEWDGAGAERYRGRRFLSQASVPQTAREIAALRRPAAMTSVDNDKMALRYDGWSGRVVMLTRTQSQQGDVTSIEVLTPKHAYYRHYPFMVGYWGGYSPYYRRYGRTFGRRYGYDTVSVGNDGTIRRSTVNSSTRSFRGGGPGWGK